MVRKEKGEEWVVELGGVFAEEEACLHGQRMFLSGLTVLTVLCPSPRWSVCGDPLVRSKRGGVHGDTLRVTRCPAVLFSMVRRALPMSR